MRINLLAAGLALVLLALAGCSSTTSSITAEGGAGDWEQFHSEFPNVSKPDTSVVRTVDPEEWASVIATCMNDAGFPDVVADGDGSLSWEGPTQQAEQLGLAKYICLAQYPLDPKYTTKPTDEQIGLVYDYLTLVQVPCIEAHGIEVPEAPSRAIFIETYLDSPEWLPYALISAEADAQGVLSELQEQCPQSPPPGSEYDVF